MSKAICPGQDTRYWKSDDIYNLQCNECGKMVEFFKDDVTRICPNCGNRIQNPKISLGCAQWCQHAKKCLGYDPAELGVESRQEGKDLSISADIISLITLRFGQDSDIIINAEKSLEKTIDLLKTSSANPKTVRVSVLLYEVDLEAYNATTESTLRDKDSKEPLPIARSIMKQAGIDSTTIDSVIEIIEACHKGYELDSPEFQVVSQTLDNMKGSLH